MVDPSSHALVLLKKVAEGDENAFRILFDRHWSNIHGLALAYFKSAVIADEIVQDVFLKIWLNRGILTKVKKFEAFLYTIARNHIYNELRKMLKDERFAENLKIHYQNSPRTPEDDFEDVESESLLHEAIAQLPPQQQAVFRLSRDQGMSQEEIARHLNITIHTVKSHMNKALRSIQDYISRMNRVALPDNPKDR